MFVCHCLVWMSWFDLGVKPRKVLFCCLSICGARIFLNQVPDKGHILHRGANYSSNIQTKFKRPLTGQGHFRGQSQFSWGLCPPGLAPRSAPLLRYLDTYSLLTFSFSEDSANAFKLRTVRECLLTKNGVHRLKQKWVIFTYRVTKLSLITSARLPESNLVISNKSN